jgi:GGDEF domain-containing protein
MGGDEFAVILVQADAVTAEAKAAALARVVEATPAQCGEWSVPLHVSYGVRQIDIDADPETVIAQADAAMFVRKRSKGERPGSQGFRRRSFSASEAASPAW